jgi:uncharacterized cupin superfamily protein
MDSTRRLLAVVAVLSGTAGWAVGAATATSTAETPRDTLVHGSMQTVKWRDVPQFGGKEAILYRSPDGRRAAGAFTHTGKYSFKFPFDEFAIVMSGSVKVTVRDSGVTHVLRQGDAVYFRAGMEVDFEAGEGYSNFAMFVGDEPLAW